MAHKNVIVIQKAGQIINPAYLTRVFKDYTTYMGVAAIYDGKLTAIKNKDSSPTLVAVEEITKVCGEHDIVFTFGKADKDIFEEDLQPFEVLKDEDGATIIAAFLEGGFEGYSQVKSTHTDEYHCVHEVMVPKLRKLYKMVSADKTIGLPGIFSAMIAELKDPVTQKDFANMWTNRGNITLVTAEGPITLSSNNIQKGDFNWGWTSNTLGYVEQTVSKTEPVVKVMSNLERLKAKVSGASQVVTGPPKPADLPAETKTDTVTAAAVVADAEGDWEWYQLPSSANNMTNRQKTELWIKEIGYKPDGFKDMKTRIRRKKGTKIGIKQVLSAANVTEVPAPADVASPIKAETVDVTGTASPEPVKDVTPHHVSMENLPLISPKAKIKIRTEWEKNAEVMRILGEDHRSMFDPKKLQELEDTYANFMETMGLGTLEDTANWSFEAFMKLGEVDLKSLAVLAFNLRNEMLKTKLLVPGNKFVIPGNQRMAM